MNTCARLLVLLLCCTITASAATHDVADGVHVSSEVHQLLSNASRYADEIFVKLENSSVSRSFIQSQSAAISTPLAQLARSIGDNVVLMSSSLAGADAHEATGSSFSTIAPLLHAGSATRSPRSMQLLQHEPAKHKRRMRIQLPLEAVSLSHKNFRNSKRIPVELELPAVYTNEAAVQTLLASAPARLAPNMHGFIDADDGAIVVQYADQHYDRGVVQPITSHSTNGATTDVSVNVSAPENVRVNRTDKAVDIQIPISSIPNISLDGTSSFQINVTIGDINSTQHADESLVAGGRRSSADDYAAASSVTLDVPYTSVNVSEGNVSVEAPFTSVNVSDGNVSIGAPFTSVNVSNGDISIGALNTSVNLSTV